MQVFKFPWALPRSQRTGNDWCMWFASLWQLVHHYIFTSIKISLTYNKTHIRPCSQPWLLFIYICSIASIHAGVCQCPMPMSKSMSMSMSIHIQAGPWPLVRGRAQPRTARPAQAPASPSLRALGSSRKT